MNKIICFDVGGTFIKYAIIDEAGTIHFKSKNPTPKSNCNETIPILMESLVREMSCHFHINGIGISTAGNVDPVKGEIIFASENIPGYTGAQLSKVLFDKLKLPCKVENDVNAAALGESWMGAGKHTSNFVCLTLGTGIGGAIIAEGKLIKGIKNGSGEIGHMVIVENGVPCGCGGSGCYERYASTSALVDAYEKAAGIETGSLDGKIVFNKVLAKDPVAINVYKTFIQHVVTGLVNLTYLLDPGLILIGGGISEAGNTFFEDLNREFSLRVMPSYKNHTHIKKAMLGNDAGLLGACKIALNN
ncbi:ROK family protein [Alkaliphilus peptidifermentans]|uniref:Glucokinase n=1 Tax=Alkaliphilus peptidifermentans DSM 18978 TaxID=1120976 RepID=A0A1G5IRP9_9FIRM|nr:ROK family protein [Alkaliphilus peptidifermentans]SCY78647.1 glucokinase [Alkaliphilus peptidifermentans DSM 18978]